MFRESSRVSVSRILQQKCSVKIETIGWEYTTENLTNGRLYRRTDACMNVNKLALHKLLIKHVNTLYFKCYIITLVTYQLHKFHAYVSEVPVCDRMTNN